MVHQETLASWDQQPPPRQYQGELRWGSVSPRCRLWPLGGCCCCKSVRCWADQLSRDQPQPLRDHAPTAFTLAIGAMSCALPPARGRRPAATHSARRHPRGQRGGVDRQPPTPAPARPGRLGAAPPGGVGGLWWPPHAQATNAGCPGRPAAAGQRALHVAAIPAEPVAAKQQPAPAVFAAAARAAAARIPAAKPAARRADGASAAASESETETQRPLSGAQQADVVRGRELISFRLVIS